MPQSRAVLLVVFLSLVGIGLSSAYADTPADSSPFPSSVNYANLDEGAGDCTTPYNLGGDSNHDGICNNWKVNSGPNPGLHIVWTNATAGVTWNYTLPCNPHATIVANPSDPQNVVDPTGYTVCPSPSNPDIYLELDWMHNHPISIQAVTDMVQAFYNEGVILHVQMGENPDATPASGDIGVHYCYVAPSQARNHGVPTTTPGCGTTSNFVSLSLLKQNYFGTTSERTAPTSNSPSCTVSQVPGGVGTIVNPTAYNCLTAKRQVFHYMLVGQKLTSGSESSGWAEVEGNDAFVASGVLTNQVGITDQQEAAVMHELGHNLGLHHGGIATTSDNEDNCKPNYLSIMSYTYEFRASGDICRPLDFSNNALSTLNEPSLTDSNVGSYPYPSNNPPPPADQPNRPSSCPTSGERPIWWSHPTLGPQTGSTGVVNDWNRGTASPYTQNLNALPTVGCTSSTTTTLNGFNDWDFIKNGALHPLVFRVAGANNFFHAIVSGGQSDEMGNGNATDEAFPSSSLPTVLPPILQSATAGTSPTSVTLSWSAPPGGSATGYTIERESPVGGGFAQIATTGSSPTTYTDNSVASSTTYNYRVFSTNSNGISTPSNSISVTTGGGSGPGSGGIPDWLIAVIVAIVVIGILIAILIWSILK